MSQFPKTCRLSVWYDVPVFPFLVNFATYDDIAVGVMGVGGKVKACGNHNQPLYPWRFCGQCQVTLESREQEELAVTMMVMKYGKWQYQ